MMHKPLINYEHALTISIVKFIRALIFKQLGPANFAQLIVAHSLIWLYYYVSNVAKA